MIVIYKTRRAWAGLDSALSDTISATEMMKNIISENRRKINVQLFVEKGGVR